MLGEIIQLTRQLNLLPWGSTYISNLRAFTSLNALVINFIPWGVNTFVWLCAQSQCFPNLPPSKLSKRIHALIGSMAVLLWTEAFALFMDLTEEVMSLGYLLLWRHGEGVV